MEVLCCEDIMPLFDGIPFAIREQEWGNQVHSSLYKWQASFDHARSNIPGKELQQIHHSDSTNPEFPSPESGPSSAYKIANQLCSFGNPPRSRSPNSSGSDTNQTAGHKRRSVKSRLHHPLGGQAASKRQSMTRRPFSAAPRNFAPSDV
ncbi:hypothetical protein E8E15_000822 [Penicillium rubens]|nr:hypothetical protein E8E15_000822 [Penicillium rubens]KAJ5051224.1 hypothetical protein NUH16_003420 [Penicillium rubens]